MKNKKTDAESRAASATVCFLLPIGLYVASLALGNNWLMMAGVAFVALMGFLELVRLVAKSGYLSVAAASIAIVYALGMYFAWCMLLGGDVYGATTVFGIQLSAQVYDFAAWLIGTRWAKKKIADVPGLEWFAGVSPNKSVGGTVGGLIVGVALTALAAFVAQKLGLVNGYAWAACVVPLAAFFGDSLGSYSKRCAGIKDSGFYKDLKNPRSKLLHALLLDGQGGYIDRYGSVAAGMVGTVCVLLLVGGIS